MDTNTYTRKFFAICPNNDMPIEYTLQITVPAGHMIQAEHITTATALNRKGYHEAIAQDLFARFGGHQVLTAHHHGVDIRTERGSL